MNPINALQERGMESVMGPARNAGPSFEKSLLADLANVDWTTLDRQRLALDSAGPLDAEEILPPPIQPASTSGDARNESAEQAGWQALRDGRVAIATVAGGQASRLGFSGPKGAFPLGPVSGTSLFQMMAGQVFRLRQLSGAALPWIIQTGPANHLETMAFFADRSYFGLGQKSVHFACQGTLPALSEGGQFLLETPGSLFRNPDGHGGFYRAIRNSGICPQLREMGVDLLYYCQVDNPLVRMADPIFLGHHLLTEARMSVKVVAKSDPLEKVGLIIEKPDGRLSCIEYSDLAPELAELRNADGQLRFMAGNLAIHCFNLDFVQEMAEAALPLHLAHKDVKVLNGNNPEPTFRPGVKFETFVFDALPLADKGMVQLALREDEFAPVKNRSGSDSIQTSRDALTLRSRRWSLAAGLPVKEQGSVEISAQLCYDQADLSRRFEDLQLKSNGHLVCLGAAR
ncbi:MAG: UTP--glucose-1-phosphate uridylyltransferase [Planctomycetes bacterium]|nr:UTP--glucose-1-phosphate uridylyltransferase [Planctomycetota bacterium]